MYRRMVYRLDRQTLRATLKQGWDKAIELAYRGQAWANDHLPPGMRLVVGVLLMIGGLLAFLPILGLWMFPLGVMIAALDVLPVLRWLRRLGGWRR